MKKIQILLLLLGLVVVPSIFITAEVRYAASVPITLEDFENPGNWSVDFSSLRCDAWESPDWVKNNGGDDSATTAANIQNQPVAANPQTPPTATPQTPPTVANTGTTGAAANTNSSGDWIRWISVDNIVNERKLTFLPLTMQKDQKDKTVMGVKGCWKDPGYNWVSVSPKQPLYTPAYPVSFSMYVWGNNYKYDLYLVVKNSEGTFSNLFLGSLNYTGWRELRINFPSYVFPINRHNDNSKLEIVKLKVLTKPNEESVGFYTYFDNMVIQQAFEQSALYDGASLNDEKW